MKTIKNNETGIAHLLVVILVVLVLGGVGFGVMHVVQSQNSSVEVSQVGEEDDIEKANTDSDKAANDNLDGTDNVEDQNED